MSDRYPDEPGPDPRVELDLLVELLDVLDVLDTYKGLFCVSS